MGIKIGGYGIPPVYRPVQPVDKKPKTREERIQESKNVRKALAAYKGSSIDVRI